MPSENFFAQIAGRPAIFGGDFRCCRRPFSLALFRPEGAENTHQQTDVSVSAFAETDAFLTGALARSIMGLRPIMAGSKV